MPDLSRSLRLLLWCGPIYLSAAQAQTVTISPSSAMVGVGFTQQLTATVTSLTNTAVTWSVLGQNSGTITSSGLYTAPLSLPGQNPVTVKALASDKKTSASIYLLIEPLGPTLTSVSPNPLPVGTFNIAVTGSGFVSGATIFVGDIQLPTTFVSSTSLKASGYEGAVSTTAVKVKNPGSLFSNILAIPVGQLRRDSVQSVARHSQRGVRRDAAVHRDLQRDVVHNGRHHQRNRTLHGPGDDAFIQHRNHHGDQFQQPEGNRHRHPGQHRIPADHRVARDRERNPGHDAAVHRDRSIQRDVDCDSRLHQQQRPLHCADDHACIQHRNHQSHRIGQSVRYCDRDADRAAIAHHRHTGDRECHVRTYSTIHRHRPIERHLDRISGLHQRDWPLYRAHGDARLKHGDHQGDRLRQSIRQRDRDTDRSALAHHCRARHGERSA